MPENKSIEQLAEEYGRQIRENREKILNEFFCAYAASIMEYNPDMSIQDLCLVEQHSYEKDLLITKYWYEYKPQFDDKFRD